jgi:gliding motility-associated-like protein
VRDFYLSFVGVIRVQRIIQFSLVLGIVTILCHATAFAPVPDLSVFDDRFATDIQTSELPSEDKKPKATDDHITTTEENIGILNVLSNDGEDGPGPGPGHEEDAIDPATVDLDPETDPIDQRFSTVSGLFEVNQTGDVTYSPPVDFYGTANIKYTVNNFRNERSNKASIVVSVTNVNDAPVITGQSPALLTTSEDQPIEILFSNFTVVDPDSSYPTGFSMTISDGDHYSVNGTTVTPDPEFFGDLAVPVTVNDGTASSNVYALQLSVTEENDPPVITGQNPNPLVTPEEQAITITLDKLVVIDPDNSYPTGFTLNVLAGTNYDVVSNVVTPVSNFNGTLSVPVTVNDGANTSDPFNLQISVTAVNDAPLITGQNPDPLITAEEQPITVEFTNLLVTDVDNPYPTGFSLSLTDGDNYSILGNVVTPDAEYTGTLTVPVIVNDGALASNSFDLEIQVTGTNDAPVIDAQVPLTIDEDNSLTVSLSHLQVTDSDNTYPDGFTLSLTDGDNYDVSGTTVIPAANYFGTLTVPVTVNDGSASSAPFNLTVTVNPINDQPVITSQVPLTTGENQPITIAFENLVVTDPDNVYPTGFVLSLLSGTSYSVSNLTVTPAAGFNGTLSVGAFVNDGTANSDVYNIQIDVTAVNDPPVITGQLPLTFAEDTPFTIQLADLTVSDPDNSFPTGFTLSVLSGTGYSVTANTVTPTTNFTGVLTVVVSVNDGTNESDPFSLQVTISPVNDAPTITGQSSLSVNEDESLTIDPGNLTVFDPDNVYPTGFTLTVFSGTNYTVSDKIITPDADFKGTLSVPVQVSDGLLTSNIFDLQVTVTDVNDAPVITGQTTVSTSEDTPVAILLSQLTVFDPDNNFPVGFALIVEAGTNYTFSGATITPSTDFNGTLNVNIKVSDGTNDSEVFQFQIQVGDTNDPPQITTQTALSTNEETAFTILLSHLTVVDPDNSFPVGFTLLVSAGENFTVSDNTITPNLNFFGTLTVPVRVNDGVNNSATFDLSVNVNPVNDAPSYDAIANVTIQENATPPAITISNISKGPGEDGQQLTFVATSGNTAVVPDPKISYNGSAATAQLTYSLVSNASGVVTITVVAVDNGSTGAPHANSYSSTFQINVSEINNAPTLTALQNLSIPEDSPQRDIALMGITAGAGESQPLSVEVITDHPELFEILQVGYTSPQNVGTLQVKSKANANGVAKIEVKVSDNGSNTSPSVNSITQSFTLTIQPVNDPPFFVSTPGLLAVVNESYAYAIEFSDVESTNLSVSAVTKPAWLSLGVTIGATAMLSGTPPPTSAGNSTVQLRVNDNGINTDQTFTLFVNTRPVVSAVEFEVTEDAQYTFGPTTFISRFSDADNHNLSSVLVTQLPSSGRLLLNGTEVKTTDTLTTGSLAQLVYEPKKDYTGQDVFYWKGNDGFHFSLGSAEANIVINPVNDAPVITLESDTLNYEVNGEASYVSALIDISDPDDDSLAQVTVYFNNLNYQPEYDILTFEVNGSIRGQFDYQFGKLVLTGEAPITEYEDVLRSIQYKHLNTLDPDLRMKSLFFAASDGNLESETAELLLNLQYSFIELDIPSGFTPNGDQANDTWVITRPGGLDQLNGAVVRVFNRRGIKVFESNGFEESWDGTWNGEVLPTDTYFFTIDLHLKSKKTYRGVVTLLR